MLVLARADGVAHSHRPIGPRTRAQPECWLIGGQRQWDGYAPSDLLSVFRFARFPSLSPNRSFASLTVTGRLAVSKRLPLIAIERNIIFTERSAVRPSDTSPDAISF